MARRERLGELAVERGFITQEDLDDALSTQERLFREGTYKSVGEILVEKGRLLPNQLEALLKTQEEAGKKRIAHYELLSKLGEGGMGAVYKARDERDGQLVALKVLPRRLAHDAEYVRRFQREGRLGLKLDHPNVVRTLDVGEGEGPGGVRYHYMAIEYVEGPDLGKILDKRKRLPEGEALDIALNAARALAHAQDVGLIHRDVKPSNILLARDGRILLADLGLARSTAPDATRYTVTGQLVGSPHYISPEQARAERDVDARADIYSLGATLYHMLTGTVPFEGGTSAVVAAKHLTEELPNPHDVNPELSDAACLLVERMMAKRREDRYSGPLPLIKDIEAVLAGKELEPAPALEGGTSSIRLRRDRLTRRLRRERRPGYRRLRTAEAAPVDAAARKRRLYAQVGAGAACAALLAGILVFTLAEKEEPRPRHRRADAPAPTLTIDLGGGVKMEMVYVKPGRFMMGSDQGKGNEKPVHEVVITQGFCLGKYEVTRGQFSSFVRATNHVTQAERSGSAWAYRDGKWGEVKGVSWRNPLYEQTDEHPVVCVSWDDAKAFCDWVGKKCGREVRLPTEAEWEYAARAGSSGSYCFGSDEGTLGDYAWYRSNSGMQTHPVGRKKPSAWGLCDMHGNVREWCADWYDGGYYAKSAREDPKGPATGKDRVFRGGSWRRNAYHCRSADRFRLLPTFRRYSIGFRAAASVDERPAAVKARADLSYQPSEIALDLGGGIKMELVYVKPGRFMMGSDQGKGDEKPVHEVVVTRGFYIGKFEVTRAQFAAFVRATNHVTETERRGWAWAHKDGTRGGGDVRGKGVSWRNPLFEQTDEHPVVCVSWGDARAFCDWLGKKTGRHVRLPTEAEWEYGCRAGSSGRHCFGSDEGTLGDYAWYRSNSGMQTHPVGRKEPSAWGLCDMHGNVWEWCADWRHKDYYERSPREDPQGPATGSQRVLRGGSWADNPSSCRSADRRWKNPANGANHSGFRAALSSAPGR